MARTLNELIEQAKQYNYIEPAKDRKYWENDDFFFKSITIVINDPDLLKATDIICGWFPPLKLLFKGTIKRYMIYCTSMNKCT
uniref:Uncharacterized protein n=1 Tax=viral metagenome TaxID=1070528 RepID=A0A6C0BUD8_9ZZZZ